MKLFICIPLWLVHNLVLAEYEDPLARRIIWLAAAAYGSEPIQCLDKYFNNSEVVRRYEVKCDDSENNTCSAYVALLHDEEAIVLAFRGSVGSDQITRQFTSAIKFKDQFRIHDVGVGDYYAEAFNALWDGGIGDLLRELGENYTDYQLWVTGHSFGAGLSSLGSLTVVSELDGRWNYTNSVHYNFGKPRIGDLKYAQLYNQLLPNSYRVVHRHDTITNLAPILFGYLHEKNWIWYNNNMTESDTYIECTGELDIRCQGYQLIDSDLWYDHRHYFGHRIPVYGKSGCVTDIPPDE